MSQGVMLIDEETYWDIRSPGWREDRAREEGREEGQRGTLLRLLAARFGTLTPEVQAHVEAATAKQLDRMCSKIFGAQTIDEVLAEIKPQRKAQWGK